MGKDTDKIKQRGHDSLPTFGVGKDLSRGQWQAVFRQIMGRDLMRPDAERHGALVMTDRALPILRGEEAIQLRKDAVARATERRPAVKALVSEEHAPMLSALKAKRRALAEAARVPAYVIFVDRTLIEMAETRPTNLDELARISGIGAKKLERYGAEFLEVLNGGSEDVHPRRRKLAVRGSGAIYDALMAAQADLLRGPDGTDKPLSCSASLLAKLAERPPHSEDALCQALGDKRAERFGPVFWSVLQENAG